MAIGYAAKLRELNSVLTQNLGVPALRWNDPRYLAILAQAIRTIDPSLMLDPKTLLQISAEARRVQNERAGQPLTDDEFDNVVQTAATGVAEYVPGTGQKSFGPATGSSNKGNEYFEELRKGNVNQFLPTSTTQQQLAETGLTRRGGEGNVADTLLANYEKAAGGRIAGGFRNFLENSAGDRAARALLSRAAGTLVGPNGQQASIVDQLSRDLGGAVAGAGFNKKIHGGQELGSALSRLQQAFDNNSQMDANERVALRAFGQNNLAQRDAVLAALSDDVGAPLRGGLQQDIDRLYSRFELEPATTQTGGFLEYARANKLF